jgi:hypothetical protein
MLGIAGGCAGRKSVASDNHHARVCVFSDKFGFPGADALEIMAFGDDKAVRLV